MESDKELFKRDTDFYLSHYDELLKQYPEQWVAILDQSVIASDPDPWQLLETLETLQERGLQVQFAMIEHLTEHPMPLIV